MPSDFDHFRNDLEMLLGIVYLRYDLDADQAADIMQDVSAQLEAGGYKSFLGAGPMDDHR